ncbi:MAG: hypothetical protein HWD58_21040 [Bacteroidota bacterium]|nr:MAG: hypothetical protein HWD58_21040 [Bacteroidota bacterium]
MYSDAMQWYRSGGVIFNDNNADGQKQSGESVGVPGITVRAFDVNGNVYLATSDLNGAYAFSGANGNAIPTNAYPVRVEFTNFPNWAFSNSGPSNSTNSSSVQFLSSPSCSVNCGAVNPINYSQSNPKVISNIYTNNDPLVSGGSSGANMALISHDYTNNTDYNYTNLANASVVGSVWAKAWNKFKKKMFVSAFLKRHCGFGPLGIGGIYQVDMVNPNSPVVSNFIDVTTLGINLGQSTFPANNAGRGMNGDKWSPNTDHAAFAGVGKYGIGVWIYQMMGIPYFS